VYAILTYGFPLILLAFEWGLRTVLVVDARAFTGPTLAAAGLSFLVPLARPKILSVQVAGARSAIVISKGDHHLIPVVWLLVLIFLFAWSGSCYASVRYPQHTVWGVDTHLFIGLGAYLLSLVMTFIKEKV
jgi:hypothetical protein